METLAPPLKRHTSGAYPTYSLTSTLHSNFRGLQPEALRFMLQSSGHMSAEGRPTKKAASDGLVDACENKALWNLDKLHKLLAEAGNRLERAPVNQVFKGSGSFEPQWVNLGTLGTYFSVSSTILGRWLDELGLREDDGMATKDSLDRGLATVVEMSAGGKNKTRKITQWNLEPTIEILMEAGKLLDFNYEASLKGKGRNSDVQVETVESRAREFAKTFSTLFRHPTERRSLPELVKKVPKPIQKKAEELLKRPGFITENQYLKFLDR